MYKNVGYGLTTYEGDTVTDIVDGKLFTGCFSSEGMSWDDRAQTWKYDGGLGLVCTIVPIDDPQALAYLAQYND